VHSARNAERGDLRAPVPEFQNGCSGGNARRKSFARLDIEARDEL